MTEFDELNRLLDEAFAPYPATPDALDLKQEVRANLTARAAELRATGVPPSDAVHRAFDEMGDLGVLLGARDTAPAAAEGWVAESRRHHVRPKPAFVIRTVVLAGLLTAALVTLVVDAFGMITLGTGGRLAGILIAAALIGWIAYDGQRQETTTDYPTSRGTAIGFAVGGGLLAVGLGGVWLLIAQFAIGWLVVAGIGVVASIALFTYFGVTRTNRRKPWVLRQITSTPEVGDRFEKDPAAAARFGMYTVLIWIVAIATFVVLSFTVGWAWSWLALLAGVVVMMAVLTRMLFVSEKR